MPSTTTPRLGAHRTPAARLGVQVVHDLVSAIVTGEVAPGDLLPTETELCENFGVSRTVIRESMKRLEEKGMVSVVQGRGTQIAPQSEWNILDKVVLGTMIATWALLAAVVVDLTIMWRSFKRLLSERYPRTSPKGLLMMAVNRAMQIRRFRQPPARIKRGASY